ncbi:MAG: TIGR02266 family protein [Myxococcota bacterium]|nr:TIGR02266 family protein [Myxococcales bacterium]
MARVSVETAGQTFSEERRRWDRTDLVVRVEYSTVDDLFSEFTRDINEGGVFIETDDPQPLGTAVTLQFHLPGAADPVKTSGIVVRSNDGATGEPMGMAVEFEELPPNARAQINEMIRALRQTR